MVLAVVFALAHFGSCLWADAEPDSALAGKIQEDTSVAVWASLLTGLLKRPLEKLRGKWWVEQLLVPGLLIAASIGLTLIVAPGETTGESLYNGAHTALFAGGGYRILKQGSGKDK